MPTIKEIIDKLIDCKEDDYLRVAQNLKIALGSAENRVNIKPLQRKNFHELPPHSVFLKKLDGKTQINIFLKIDGDKKNFLCNSIIIFI